MKKERNLGLDILRIIAILCVLYNHRESYNYYNIVPIGSFKYFVLTGLAVVSRCGPPLFFMISGILLLGKEEDFGTIFKHRIMRILIVMIPLTLYAKYYWDSVREMSLITIYATKLNWYLYAYCGYLVMLPILRIIAKNVSVSKMKYFICVTIIVYSIKGIFIPFGIDESFSNSMTLFGTTWGSNCWHITFPLFSYMSLKIFQSCEENIKRRNQLFMWMVGTIITIVCACLLMWYDIVNNGAENSEQILQHAVLIPSQFIILTMYYLCEVVECKCEFTKRCIQFGSTVTFGIFLLETHTSISEYIFQEVVKLEKYVGRYACSIITIFISYALLSLVVGALKKIPIVNKVL